MLATRALDLSLSEKPDPGPLFDLAYFAATAAQRGSSIELHPGRARDMDGYAYATRAIELARAAKDDRLGAFEFGAALMAHPAMRHTPRGNETPGLGDDIYDRHLRSAVLLAAPKSALEDNLDEHIRSWGGSLSAVRDRAKKEIAAAKQQSEALQQTLCSAQADLQVTGQQKTQLAEYQAMEALCNSEVRKLQGELKMLSDSQALLQEHLTKSRERELALEQRLNDTVGGGSGAAMDVSQNESKVAEEVAVKVESGATDSTAQQQSVYVQQIAELHSELADARNNINDLISEIEAVAAEEVKARTQSGRLLRQIAEYQSMQRAALEENLRLQNQIEDIKMRHSDTETKMELMKNVMQQQDALLAQIRQSEQVVRGDCHTFKKTAQDVSTARLNEEQKLLEAKQKLEDTQHGVKSALKRNVELQKRCDELTSQCESERKQRYNIAAFYL